MVVNRFCIHAGCKQIINNLPNHAIWVNPLASKGDINFHAHRMFIFVWDAFVIRL